MLKKRVPKCYKCSKPLDLKRETCMYCGAILDAKTNMLKKDYLKKMKEI